MVNKPLILTTKLDPNINVDPPLRRSILVLTWQTGNHAFLKSTLRAAGDMGRGRENYAMSKLDKAFKSFAIALEQVQEQAKLYGHQFNGYRLRKTGDRKPVTYGHVNAAEALRAVANRSKS